MWVNYERSRFQPFWVDTAEIVQLLLGALVVLILHQPGEHCRYPRFMIVQELVPITGQNCDSIMRDWDFSHFGLIQLTLPNCCWVLWLCWCCTSLGNIVGTPDFRLFKNLCFLRSQKCESIMRDQDFNHFGLIQLTLPKCCWVLGLCWCCTSLGNIVGTQDFGLFKNMCL